MSGKTIATIYFYIISAASLALIIIGIFNGVNFGLPLMTPFAANGRPDPQAGQIRQTATSAREIQLALRYIF